MDKNIVVIPARYQSSRFPGKPLIQIASKSLIQRTWSIASKAVGLDNVYIATDDTRIEEAVKSFTNNVILTSSDCKTGSERVEEAVGKIDREVDIVVNFQGDAVLTPPWIVSDLISALQENEQLGCATPAVKLNSEQYKELLTEKQNGNTSGTTVVFDKNNHALYFSKQVIPLVRNQVEPLPVYRHIGMYAYRPSTLGEFNSLDSSVLEQVEGLEQLRLLENGIKILVVPVDYQGRTHCSIDNPVDVEIAERIITKEGELL